MNTSFEPRTIVNGAMLRQFVGQPVSIMLQVEDEAGTNLIGMSTDNQKIRVTLAEPLESRKGDWVEIIGKSGGPDSIRATEGIVFNGENINFDSDAYNMVALFMNNCKEIFRHV